MVYKLTSLGQVFNTEAKVCPIFEGGLVFIASFSSLDLQMM